MVGEAMSLGSRHDASSAAHEQLRAQLLRQTLKLQTDRAWGDTQPLGSLSDGRVLHHRQENFDLPGVHSVWDCIRPLSWTKRWGRSSSWHEQAEGLLHKR